MKPVGGSLSALKDGVPASVVELNRMGFGHMRILACIGQLPESGLMHYGSVGFFLGLMVHCDFLLRNLMGHL